MIIAKNLCLELGGNVILDDVSFQIKKGQYIGLIGPNGAGKTSLIKVILGFYKPTNGALELSPDIRIGYVPQGYCLSAVVPISVREVLKMSGGIGEELFVQSLQKVGFGRDFLSQNFHKLSGGQKQRIIIARALCQEPNLIIFDEPLNGIDFETKIQIYELLSHLNQTEKLTILFVSHEVDHIIGKCHHILCLNTTMHTGCHPMDFAQGKNLDCPVLETGTKIIPVHHHHTHNDPLCFY